MVPTIRDTKTRREPSKRWQRANARVGRIHAKVAAIRAHEIHHATTALATRHEVVAVEQLSAKNMSRRGGRRKRGLNRALGDAALGRIRAQLGLQDHLVRHRIGDRATVLCVDSAVFALRSENQTPAARSDLPLPQRMPTIGRDLNAAINLARLGDPPTVGKRGPVPAVGRPPASRLEMDVEPSRRPAPPPRRWGRQEATKRQPRTPLTRVRGPQLRKEKLPEMPSHTNTHISGNGYGFGEASDVDLGRFLSSRGWVPGHAGAADRVQRARGQFRRDADESRVDDDRRCSVPCARAQDGEVD